MIDAATRVFACSPAFSRRQLPFALATTISARRRGGTQRRRSARPSQLAEAIEQHEASLDRPLAACPRSCRMVGHNGADSEHLPGAVRSASTTVPGAASAASDAAGTAAVRPAFHNGHGDCQRLAISNSRSAVAHVASRGIAVGHIAPYCPQEQMISATAVPANPGDHNVVVPIALPSAPPLAEHRYAAVPSHWL